MTVRELNGDPQATVTFSADGAVLSVAVSEPRFTATDKAVLLASRRSENDRGSHGMLMSEALDPANQYKFTVGPPVIDHAAAALEKAKKAYRDRWPEADMGSMLWRVEKL